MRVFVAGSSGQVALSLKEASAKEGIELITAGRPDFDLTDADGTRAAIKAFGPTAIINAAAYTAVDAAENDEETAIMINADGAATLAAIAHELEVPFLHISTDYVFDGMKEGPYQETDAPAPTGAYGRSKLAGEVAVMAANPNAMIFRTAWVYSPFGKNFLKTMLILAKTREELGVVGDQIGNPTYAPDIAEALLQVLKRIDRTGWQDSYAGIYHLAGTGSVSWHGFAEAIFEAGAANGHPKPSVKSIATADYPTPAKRPANSQLDCSKLGETFDVHLPSWEQSTVLCVKRLFESGELG
ncbi:MAG: dTDP-4-dehydrorhamnose reductase [Alphaproteobacteria bacterium]|nr:dTDP-4-dehydrorhamnose reductase [Alphaproteobacteria bacterium]